MPVLGNFSTFSSHLPPFSDLTVSWFLGLYLQQPLGFGFWMLSQTQCVLKTSVHYSSWETHLPISSSEGLVLLSLTEAFWSHLTVARKSQITLAEGCFCPLLASHLTSTWSWHNCRGFLIDLLVSVPHWLLPEPPWYWQKWTLELYAGSDHFVTPAYSVILNWLLKSPEFSFSRLESGDISICPLELLENSGEILNVKSQVKVQCQAQSRCSVNAALIPAETTLPASLNFLQPLSVYPNWFLLKFTYGLYTVKWTNVIYTVQSFLKNAYIPVTNTSLKYRTFLLP